jgi:hypothetical protein
MAASIASLSARFGTRSSAFRGRRVTGEVRLRSSHFSMAARSYLLVPTSHASAQRNLPA